ncbi:cytochrome bd-I oxidase subunit CydX [Propionivibrio limicola]|nr:cytochrome bd-I oxidase subunit CydX [Propionivibrio limicola]
MWYFAWILGLGFAIWLSVFSALRQEVYESRQDNNGGQN